MADDVKRGDLRKIIETDGIIPPLYAIDIARQVLKALQPTHGWNAGHGGIRPHNIRIEKSIAVREDGKKRIAYRAELNNNPGAEPNRIDTAATALRYRPPEMLQGAASPTPSGDLYAVGVLLYEMMTGTPPFGIELPGELNPVVPPSLDRLVKKAMSHDPRRRHRSIEEMEKELNSIEDEIVRHLRTTRKSRDEARASRASALPRLREALRPVLHTRGTRWVLLSLGVAVALFVLLLLTIPNHTAPVNPQPSQPDIIPYRLKIATIPPGAEIAFDGTRAGVTPKEFLTLEHEPHTVKLSMTYHEEKLLKLLPTVKDGRKIFRCVEETAGRETEIADPSQIALARQRATLIVDCDPVRDVDIAVDGKPAGKTRRTFEGIEAGVHTIALTREGYAPLTKEVVLPANATAVYTYSLQKLSDPPPPVKKTWSIWLKSAPDGAAVTVDGVERGVTPAFITNLDAGIRQIRVAKKYFRSVEEKRVIDSDLELNFELQRVKGTLRVDTNPPGAVVFVDDARFGAAPQFPQLEGGTYKIRAVMEGFREASCDVEIAEEKQYPVVLTLERLPLGTLKVASAVPSPHVRVNGTARGAAPLELPDLNPGTYSVRLFDTTKEIEVKPGGTTAAEFTLEDLGMAAVPAGDFVMGGSEGAVDERPRSRITLDAYYMDKCEVTNRRYGLFLDHIRKTNDHALCHRDEGQGKDHTPVFWGDDSLLDHPVVGVDWFDCYAYAAWAGKRLPTEAEWEKAARGDKGNLYPWGFQWSDTFLNWSENGKLDNFKGTAPSGSFTDGASPYGCLNMSGNVWEWTSSWYDSQYYRVAPKANPPGPASGVFKSLRGGSYLRGKDVQRCSARHYSSVTTRLNDCGFRCALSAGR